MAGQVAAEVMEDRLARLQALLGDQQRAFNETTVGKRVDVLLERPGRRMGQLVGKSPWLQSVHVEVAGAAIGDLVTVDIVRSEGRRVGKEGVSTVRFRWVPVH